MEDLYFKNEEARLIFGLAELGGKQQLDLLGIKMIHYTDKDVSKAWYEEIKSKIKNCKHPKINEALEQLERLYKGMND